MPSPRSFDAPFLESPGVRGEKSTLPFGSKRAPLLAHTYARGRVYVTGDDRVARHESDAVGCEQHHRGALPGDVLDTRTLRPGASCETFKPPDEITADASSRQVSRRHLMHVTSCNLRMYPRHLDERCKYARYVRYRAAIDTSPPTCGLSDITEFPVFFLYVSKVAE